MDLTFLCTSLHVSRQETMGFFSWELKTLLSLTKAIPAGVGNCKLKSYRMFEAFSWLATMDKSTGTEVRQEMTFEFAVLPSQLFPSTFSCTGSFSTVLAKQSVVILPSNRTKRWRWRLVSLKRWH
jgi:hypothetical protein